jgi:hypothetical protein
MAVKAPILPFSVVGRVDVAHLSRELEAVDNFLEQARMRQPGIAVAMPRMSKLLEELATANEVNLLDKNDRASLATFLKELREHAPVLHFSFAAEPTGVFMQKLLEWLRAEIHPLVLVDIGLQPSIAAGCVLRSTSKYFDFSLRQHFQYNRDKLITLIAGEQK